MTPSMEMPQVPASQTFVFVSRTGAWGGSEELWSTTAAALASRGHRVTAYTSNLDDTEPALRRLRDAGCKLHDLARFPLMPRALFRFVGRMSPVLKYAHQILRLAAGLLTSRRPDLVVISQGVNYDGCGLASVCRRLGIPYAIIAQKATDVYWPPDRYREAFARIYADARAAYFVAEHNKQLTEEQLGMELPHATVVRNPFLVPWERRDDWPADDGRLRLACIGRMYPSEKGQDLLLRVLARERWRQRPLSVTFYGRGDQAAGLERMAAHLGLRNVHFAGFADDVAHVWETHHGLILPSRCEGLPLVLVEAMLCGRVPIVTNVAGNAEVVRDNVTGFLAAAPTEDALDEAMERAWQARDDWRTIARAAAARIRVLVPPAPQQVMADRLEQLVTAGAEEPLAEALSA